MATFASTTKTYELSDSYSSSSLSGTQTCKLTITVDDSGNGTWDITMTNSYGGKEGMSVSLYLYINENKIYDAYYKDYTTFPCKNNTSSDGTFTVGEKESFKVDLAVCCMQEATSKSNPGRLTNGVAARLGNSTDGWGETFDRDIAYTITYNANGGISAPSDQIKTSGVSLNLSADKPSRVGYTFKGWGTSSNDTTVDYQPGASAPDEDLNLYAIWSEHFLTLHYFSNFANYGKFKGNVIENISSDTNIEVAEANFLYSKAYSSGLNNAQNENSLHLSRTGYAPTGDWSNSINGDIIVNQGTPFSTGQALAEAFGETLEGGNVSINVYPQWECIRYFKKNDEWNPCEIKVLQNGKWVFCEITELKR
jgi:uncharacterized repeat protein (TIGR02543 family)